MSTSEARLRPQRDESDGQGRRKGHTPSIPGCHRGGGCSGKPLAALPEPFPALAWPGYKGRLKMIVSGLLGEHRDWGRIWGQWVGSELLPGTGHLESLALPEAGLLKQTVFYLIEAESR